MLLAHVHEMAAVGKPCALRSLAILARWGDELYVDYVELYRLIGAGRVRSNSKLRALIVE